MGCGQGRGRDGAEGWSQKDIQTRNALQQPWLQLPRPRPRLPSAPPLSAPEDFLRMGGWGSRAFRGALMLPPSVSRLGWSRAPSRPLTCKVGPGTSWFSRPSGTSDPALQPTPGACQAGHPWSLHSCHLLSARPGALPPAGAPATQQSRPSSSQAAAANGTLSAYSADEEIAIKGG